MSSNFVAILAKLAALGNFFTILYFSFYTCWALVRGPSPPPTPVTTEAHI